MCGIAGFIDFSRQTSVAELNATAGQMAGTLRHRGPDDSGVWTDPEAGIALGHRRLSIIDLSPKGHQPMISPSGRLVIVYNGEVYNFRELRGELEAQGRQFRSSSDTEVVIEACEAWGVEETARRLNGMFAFALWDRQRRMLTLVRDRLGIKPLYWGRFGDLFLFGSELKALRAHSGWTPHLDRDAVAAFMRHNYVPAPHAIYKGIYKLEPGCVLTYTHGGQPKIERYWDLNEVAQRGLADPLALDDSEAVAQLDSILRDAVHRHMIADVPLGAFLSGGIDSSTVVALMQAQSNRPIRTFSIGFYEDGYNEAPYAKEVAAHLGTDHTELYVEASHALGIIPQLAEWYDEPFADSSQIPTYLISEMTRRHVTVALSGDGGDELFAGYDRYFRADAMWQCINWVPRSLRYGAATALRALSPQMWDRIFSTVPGRWQQRLAGDKMHKLAQIIGRRQPDALYRELVSHWDEPGRIVLGAKEPRGVLWDEKVADRVPRFMDRMRLLDTLTYLPDDILTKVDRASMAVSLEVRVPILDHRVVEFAWRLPPDLISRNGQAKWLLRQVLNQYIPRRLIDRPKMGFGVPIGTWLRDPLRDWAETLLDERRLREDGIFDPVPIREAWSRHLAGEPGWGYRLWDVLMFQAWQESQGGGVASVAA